MKFYIVTPTFNNWSWLQACIKSVADQATNQLHIHHHVQDGGSTDGSPDQLAAWQTSSQNIANYTFSYESGRDQGMYDAINRAWAKMPADTDFTAHLNSDEQYLPNTLASVVPHFTKHPKAEILLGSYIILDDDLGYVAHRRPVKPALWSSRLNCTCITCSTFYRASAFRQRKIGYDSKWKIIGDLVLYRDLCAQKAKFQTIPVMTSTFVCTGENLAWSPQIKDEWRILVKETPAFYLKLRKYPYQWVNLKRRIRNRFMSTPTEYQVYEGDATQRCRIAIRKPNHRWRLFRKADTSASQRQD